MPCAPHMLFQPAQQLQRGSMDSEKSVTRPLRLLEGEFVVPAYQRGYRWTAEQVNALLEDITPFCRQKNDLIYFLQPIVVHRLPGPDVRWELIDGQQRLTTIYLINAVLRAIKECRSEIRFTLTFTSRPGSGVFLQQLAENPSEYQSIKHEDNIDYFHIKSACGIIYEHFKALDESRQFAGSIYDRFAENVHVLWYEIPDTISGESVKRFTRLNMGRIPLTAAELNKALLLSPANHNLAKELAFSSDAETSLRNRFVAQVSQKRQVLLGSQWDDVERELHDPDFWAFLGGQDENRQPTRMDFLLNLYVAKPERETRDYFSFHELSKKLSNLQEKDAQDIWDEVMLKYQRLRFWFEDHNYYHWVGFLIQKEGNSTLRELLQLAGTIKKSKFDDHVFQRIRDSIKKGDKSPDLDALQYGTDNKELLDLLFLFNIEYLRQLQCKTADSSSYKYIRRFPFGLHSSKKWSLEHIEAQNVEGLKTVEQWNRWVEDHQKALLDIHTDVLPHKDDLQRGVLSKEKIKLLEQCTDFLARKPKEATRENFDKLSESVVTFIDTLQEEGALKTHGLQNLALLDGKTNTRLSNSIFIAKRTILIDIMKDGGYIPPATESVFMRYFTNEGQGIPYWSKADRDAYMRQIKDTLSFFWPELSTEEELSCRQ